MLEQVELSQVVALAKQAGEAIMQVYTQDFEVEFKADHSPLTLADQQAHAVIEAGLTALNKQWGFDLPILSEEGKEISYKERQHWTAFWLVDPLDGTKEFVKKNDEFTVNIALIDQGVPVLGVVYAPAIDVTYAAKQGEGAFKNNQPLPLPQQRATYRIVASRSHLSTETERFIEDIQTDLPKEVISIGSSLKICLVAEGAADIYPRLGPTMEWDTAAAHAVVLAAGKQLQKYSFEMGYEAHCYNKENLLNGWFVVYKKLF